MNLASPVCPDECIMTELETTMRTTVGRERGATGHSEPNTLRVNLALWGEPVLWYFSWKRRGLVGSVKDAVLMAFQALQEKVTEQDLRRAQLETLTKSDQR
jgi:hypothetical protein